MTRFRDVAPVLPVRDVAAALAHYAALGFTTTESAEPGYAFVERDDVWLHLSGLGELDPLRNNTSAYLYVADADALHAEWQAAGVAGRLYPPEDMPYGLREGAHIDPDGNLLRFGSALG